jgi:hypothetical protein
MYTFYYGANWSLRNLRQRHHKKRANVYADLTPCAKHSAACAQISEVGKIVEILRDKHGFYIA